jgi:hypothetical protein
MGLLPDKAESIEIQRGLWVVATQEKRKLYKKKMSAIFRYKELQEQKLGEVEELLALQL